MLDDIDDRRHFRQPNGLPSATAAAQPVSEVTSPIQIPSFDPGSSHAAVLLRLCCRKFSILLFQDDDGKKNDCVTAKKWQPHNFSHSSRTFKLPNRTESGHKGYGSAESQNSPSNSAGIFPKSTIFFHEHTSIQVALHVAIRHYAYVTRSRKFYHTRSTRRDVALSVADWQMSESSTAAG